MSIWKGEYAVPAERCCRFNKYVDCGDSTKNEQVKFAKCAHCGWNPVEHKRRVAILHGEL